MNEQITERLDSQDEMIDQLVTKVGTLENRDYPDYKQATAELKQAAQNLKTDVADVRALVKTLPKFLPVKHTLDLKSKWVIIGGCIWFAFTALLTGWNISLHAENETLKAQALKYRAIRQTYPLQSDWADSLYRRDPDSLERMTVQLEEQSIASSHAKAIAEQKAQEAESAKENANQLSKKSKLARKHALSGNNQ